MKKLAVCGLDKEYVKRLGECFINICGKDTEVLIFTDSNAISDYLIKDRIDVCIALEDFEIDNREQIGSLVLLTEDENASEKVYKYMSCDKIYSEAMALCAKNTEISNRCYSSDDKMLIGIYTPVKRSLQTSFALTIGQILSRKKKVLYLNFESFSGFDSLTGKLGGSDLMDLLYFSECEDSNFAYRVDSLKERMGELDYISPARAFVKFSLVTAAQWERLLGSLTEKTDYEVIILDLSENIVGLLDILKRCSLVYTITDSDRVATAKLAQYENMLRESGYKGILDKTEEIKIPKLREIPCSFELLPHSELADYVRKLIHFDMGGDINE